MINEEKLRLMTKTALLEQQNRQAFRINRYYKKDYVSYHMILLWICVTMAFVMVAGAVGIVYIEQYPEAAQKLDWRYVFFVLLMGYIILVVAYVIIAMFVYTVRYERAQTVVKKYTGFLKQLDKEYEWEAYQNALAEAEKKHTEEGSARKKNAVKRKGGSKG
jgi:cell division protein FtsL